MVNCDGDNLPILLLIEFAMSVHFKKWGEMLTFTRTELKILPLESPQGNGKKTIPKKKLFAQFTNRIFVSLILKATCEFVDVHNKQCSNNPNQNSQFCPYHEPSKVLK